MRLTQVERDFYDSLDNIDVYWQPKAWADSSLTLQWLNRTWKRAIADTPGTHLLFCDNLAGQDADSSQPYTLLCRAY
eukprot:COSAG01_NODE_12930_length_1661_cov_4.371319_1_plen_77_part_00